jgi:hypothetical protein
MIKMIIRYVERISFLLYFVKPCVNYFSGEAPYLRGERVEQHWRYWNSGGRRRGAARGGQAAVRSISGRGQAAEE